MCVPEAPCSTDCKIHQKQVRCIFAQCHFSATLPSAQCNHAGPPLHRHTISQVLRHVIDDHANERPDSSSDECSIQRGARGSLMSREWLRRRPKAGDAVHARDAQAMVVHPWGHALRTRLPWTRGQSLFDDAPSPRCHQGMRCFQCRLGFGGALRTHRGKRSPAVILVTSGLSSYPDICTDGASHSFFLAYHGITQLKTSGNPHAYKPLETIPF